MYSTLSFSSRLALLVNSCDHCLKFRWIFLPVCPCCCQLLFLSSTPLLCSSFLVSSLMALSLMMMCPFYIRLCVCSDPLLFLFLVVFHRNSYTIIDLCLFVCLLACLLNSPFILLRFVSVRVSKFAYVQVKTRSEVLKFQGRRRKSFLVIQIEICIMFTKKSKLVRVTHN